MESFFSDGFSSAFLLRLLFGCLFLAGYPHYLFCWLALSRNRVRINLCLLLHISLFPVGRPVESIPPILLLDAIGSAAALLLVWPILRRLCHSILIFHPNWCLLHSFELRRRNGGDPIDQRRPDNGTQRRWLNQSHAEPPNKKKVMARQAAQKGQTTAERGLYLNHFLKVRRAPGFSACQDFWKRPAATQTSS